MFNNFILGSFIGKLKSANQHHKLLLVQRKTKLLTLILKMLFKENIIKNYILKNNFFYIYLRSIYYHTNLIKEFSLVSKPSKKTYISYYELQSLLYKHKFNKVILSTNKGIMFGEEALNLKLGGELLFKVVF